MQKPSDSFQRPAFRAGPLGSWDTGAGPAAPSPPGLLLPPDSQAKQRGLAASFRACAYRRARDRHVDGGHEPRRGSAPMPSTAPPLMSASSDLLVDAANIDGLAQREQRIERHLFGPRFQDRLHPQTRADTPYDRRQTKADVLRTIPSVDRLVLVPLLLFADEWSWLCRFSVVLLAVGSGWALLQLDDGESRVRTGGMSGGRHHRQPHSATVARDLVSAVISQVRMAAQGMSGSGAQVRSDRRLNHGRRSATC